jgi:hypothetical protein
MEKETLHFKIGLSGSSPVKQPEISIAINENEFFSGCLTLPPNETEYFEFDAEINEGDNSIVIKLKNKQSSDTVLDLDKKIQSDLLLNIESIEIDEIDLGSLLWTNSKYIPVYPADYVQEQKKLNAELNSELQYFVNLGWNGTWIFPFQSPFYIWLLENI